MIQNQEFIFQFMEEANAHLAAVETILIDHEEMREDAESINTIFRAVHSIKGTAGFFGLSKIVALAHAMENVFGEIRKGKKKLEDHSVDIFLLANDQLKTMVNDALNSEEVDVSDIVNQVNKILESGNNDFDNGKKEIVIGISSGFRMNFAGSSYDIVLDGLRLGHKLYEIKLRMNKELLSYKEGPIKLFNRIQSVGMLIDSIADYSEINSLEDVLDAIAVGGKDVYLAIIVTTDLNKEDFARAIYIPSECIQEMKIETERKTEKQTGPQTDLQIDLHSVAQIKKQASDDFFNFKSDIQPEIKQKNEELVHAPQAKGEDDPKKSISSNQMNISVNLRKLDQLMDLIGELVISETMVTSNPEIEKLEIESFQKASRHHRKIITEIKEIVMSVRMVPLATTFQKMKRLVRDTGQKLNKEIVLEVIGEDTEVDKNITESISDPLVHLIRNSIDHGIETPEERKNKGKDPVGKLTLEAKSLGGDVIITVRDDGKGLDKDKLYKKASRNGLTNKARSELTDREIFSFIFIPGFSTNENVTEFSGRGVGMDVVFKNIKKLGGTVDIESVKDVGTSIYIKIPLTLAIIDGMVIAVGNSSYVIPTIHIRRCFKPQSNEIISDPDGNEMIMVEGECYHIIRLHNRFHVKTTYTDMVDGIIILVEDEDGAACLFADRLIGQQQVVVKSLPRYIEPISGISGCTLLGDGSISLIIELSVLLG